MQQHRLWTNMVALIGTALLLSAWGGRPVFAQAKPVVVVHLTHYTDDLHAASMALKLANAMQQKGAQVTLMLDMEGVRLVSTHQPQDLRWGTSDAIAGYYDAFVKGGGQVVVCPHCAKAAGLDDKSLRTGAKIVTEEALANALLRNWYEITSTTEE
ncbi:MAG: DsrE family protein [Candidatus Binatia bacterium]